MPLEFQFTKYPVSDCFKSPNLALHIKLYNENTLKWETEHMVNVAIDKQLAGVTSIELKGDLSVTSQVQIRYIGGNSICLEMLQLESLEDTETHFDMIQVN